MLTSMLITATTSVMADTSIFPTDLKELEPVKMTNTRNMRFAEFLVINPPGEKGAVGFNTGKEKVEANIKKTIDLEKIKEKYQAEGVILNGPKYWMCDSHSLWMGGTSEFGHLKARWVANLPVSGLDEEGGKPYQIYSPKKTHYIVYEAGKPVYELVDPDGKAYVLQARSEDVPLEWLPTLGERFKKLPKGWSYRTRILEKDLILDLKRDEQFFNVGDEFHQYYQRDPKND